MTASDRGFGDLSAYSDEQLIERYRELRDRRAFDQLVHRYERELYSYLRRYLGNAEAAEDVFQATFLQIHLKSNQFEEGRKFRPWLYSIATNQAIDSQRHNRRHRIASLDGGKPVGRESDFGPLVNVLASNEPGPASILESDERRRWVQNAVQDLPEPLRAAVVLVYYQGLKYRDAAEALDIPVGTVKSRLHAAVIKLNEAWTATHRGENN
jgi:RNA polymerase sigma-70 factor (ECF subfamily)